MGIVNKANVLTCINRLKESANREHAELSSELSRGDIPTWRRLVLEESKAKAAAKVEVLETLFTSIMPMKYVGYVRHDKQEEEMVLVPRACIPEGARLVEAYIAKDNEIIVVGEPEDDLAPIPEGEESGHDCDRRGCSTLSHVIFRIGADERKER